MNKTRIVMAFFISCLLFLIDRYDDHHCNLIIQIATRQYNIASFVVFELSHIAQSPVWIRRCHNPACEKFFVAKRIDARYCKSPDPQNEKIPCNKYYPQYIKRQIIRNNEVDRAEKNALSRLGMYKKRHPDLEYEINKLKRIIQTSDMKTRVLKGEFTVGQYKDWLNTHKCQEEEEVYDE